MISKYIKLLYLFNTFEFVSSSHFIGFSVFSVFIEIFRLRDTKSSSVIATMKHIFSIHGTPKILFSDNGPQYASREFRNFSISWDFEHNTSSPESPQSNGLVEREIQTVRRVIRKAEESNEDHYLALLNLNAIPLKDGRSPAEKMFNRRIRMVLPSMIEFPRQPLQPKPTQHSHERYDQGALSLKPIETTVRNYSKDRNNWKKKGKILSKSSQPRSC